MNVVRCSRAGARPVMMAARDGEQIGDATYARREPQSVGGEPIEVGRAVLLAAVRAEVIDAEIVGEDEHDVRRPLLEGRRAIAGDNGKRHRPSANRGGYGGLGHQAPPECKSRATRVNDTEGPGIRPVGPDWEESS